MINCPKAQNFKEGKERGTALVRGGLGCSGVVGVPELQRGRKLQKSSSESCRDSATSKGKQRERERWCDGGGRGGKVAVRSVGGGSEEESQTNREGGAGRRGEAFINMMFVISERLPQQMFLCVPLVRYSIGLADSACVCVCAHEVSGLYTAQSPVMSRACLGKCIRLNRQLIFLHSKLSVSSREDLKWPLKLRL